MRRRWQIAVVVGTVLGASGWWGIPWYAKRVVLHELAAAGWPEVRIAHLRLGWGTATVDGLSLDGSETLTIRHASTTWDLATVRLDGVRVQLPDLDPAPLRPRPLAGPAAPPRWPIGTLILTDVAITAGAHQASLAGQIVRLDDTRLHLTLAGLADTTVVSATGTVTLAGEVDARIQLTDFDVAQLGLTTVQLAGKGTGDLRVVRTAEHLTVTGPCMLNQAQADIPGLGPVQVARATGTLSWNAGATGDLHLTNGRGTTHGIPWEAPDLHLGLSATTITARGTLQAFATTVAVDGSASRDLGTVATTVTIPELDLTRLRPALARWWPLTQEASGRGNLRATIRRGPSGWRGHANLTLTKAAISDAAAGVSLTLPEASAELSGSYTDALQGTAVLRVAHGTLSAPNLSVASIDGTLPWSLGRDPQLDGSLQFSNLRVHGLPVTRLTAHVRGVDGRIGGAAAIALLGTGTARLDGWYTLPGQHGEFAVVVPRFTLPDLPTLRQAIPALGNREISGDLTADGTLVVDAGALTPRIRIGINEGRLSDPELKLTISGLAATTTVTGFSPLTTSGDAPINFAACTLGTQEFGHGDARVTARLPAGIDIAKASLAWCGGHLLSPKLTIDLNQRAISGEIGLQRIELGALLAATIPRYATGNGLISGKLPLRLTWPDWTFTFGQGALYADPPPGWLHLLDRTGLDRAIATGIAAVDRKIIDTVADLVFDDLRVDLVPETPLTAVAKVTLTGHGRTGDPPLAVGGFTVNLRGLEKALANALFIQGWRPTPAPARDPSLDRFFAPGP